MKSLFLISLFLPLACYSQQAQQYQVIIDEIFADPSPSQGLPEDEFIELKNISGKDIQLQNWTLTDSVSTAIFPDYILKPDSFLTVCETTHAADFLQYGNVLGVSHFPSLNNDGDWLLLKSAEGQLIDAVHYDISWYQDNDKSKGGWSLEMINTHQPCEGSNNWTASVAPKGGTPGSENSVNNDDTKSTLPDLLSASAIDGATIKLFFNKSLDSSSAANYQDYFIDNNIGYPAKISLNGPLFQQVTLSLSQPLQKGKIYTVTVNNIKDCEGNLPGIYNTAQVGIPEPVDSFDIALNEILYHPKPGGTEFVELYNRSDKILDLQQVWIARKINGDFKDLARLSNQGTLFFPGKYLVITKNKDGVTGNYFCQNPNNFLELAGMPALPDAGGTIALLDDQKNVIDEFSYDDSYQSTWIINVAGVSLERINYNAQTQLKSNWHSASAEVGYATPTYQNSQFGQSNTTDIQISPDIISPDNDGTDDVAEIHYQNSLPDAAMNITIYNAAGRPVRYLLKNQLLGTKGKFTWNGKGENNQDLPVGIYVVWINIISSNGQVQQYKHTVTIIKKLD